jgi:prepilin-type N-terminal cleavage/methylation domain-containing protein
MNHNKNKKAFSLLELIFVLVILGIVASLSSQIIIQVYENYIMQRAVYNVSTKTELVSNQIVNRLTYRIPNTTISKNHDTFFAKKDDSSWKAEEGRDWLNLSEVPTGEEYTTIEWIGYDNDGFATAQQPYWSGIADYENNASVSNMDTPGSNLNKAATLINTLSNGEVDLNNRPAAVLFAENNNYYTGSNTYTPVCMGLIQQDSNSSTNCIFPVTRSSDTRFTFPESKPKIITERYKLAWSAYTIAPHDPDGDGLHDLMLYYNYQPWNGESYLDNTTSRSTLMHNVTVFKFSESGGVIRFKLCASENIGQDFNVTTCKEKVVIR